MPLKFFKRESLKHFFIGSLWNPRGSFRKFCRWSFWNLSEDTTEIFHKIPIKSFTGCFWNSLRGSLWNISEEIYQILQREPLTSSRELSKFFKGNSWKSSENGSKLIQSNPLKFCRKSFWNLLEDASEILHKIPLKNLHVIPPQFLRGGLNIFWGNMSNTSQEASEFL